MLNEAALDWAFGHRVVAPEAVVYDGAVGHGPADDVRLALDASMRDLPFIEITSPAAKLPAPAPRRAESCAALARLQADLPSALATQLARAVGTCSWHVQLARAV